MGFELRHVDVEVVAAGIADLPAVGEEFEADAAGADVGEDAVDGGGGGDCAADAVPGVSNCRERDVRALGGHALGEAEERVEVALPRESHKEDVSSHGLE